MRELLKCLAYASLQSSDSGGDIDIDNKRDSSSDNNLEEEEDDNNKEDEDGGYDLRCPLQVCEQKEEFVTEKELNRHFATRITTHSVFEENIYLGMPIDIPCYKFCPLYERVFDRASC